MDLVIPYRHCYAPLNAFDKVVELLKTGVLEGLGIKATITTDKKKLEIIAKGRGFTITLLFDPDGVEGQIELSLLLRPLRKRIVSELKEKLSETV